MASVNQDVKAAASDRGQRANIYVRMHMSAPLNVGRGHHPQGLIRRRGCMLRRSAFKLVGWDELRRSCNTHGTSHFLDTIPLFLLYQSLHLLCHLSQPNVKLPRRIVRFSLITLTCSIELVQDAHPNPILGFEVAEHIARIQLHAVLPHLAPRPMRGRKGMRYGAMYSDT